MAATASLDSRELDEAAAAKLRQLVTDVRTNVDLGALGARSDAPAVPDAFDYEIEIVAGADDFRLALTDPQIPPDLRALLTHVWSTGRGNRERKGS